MRGETFRADNETRTRDLNLGKVALYQLSYVRLLTPVRFPGPKREWNISPCVTRRQNHPLPVCCDVQPAPRSAQNS